MFDFSKVTEVSLSVGDHESPEAGMCLMEMAAWFAGEEHSDKPQCACPVLGAYGRDLNDSMPDDLRNDLLRPLVPLIVGTRNNALEQKRAEFLAMWTINKILPLVLVKLPEHAKACRDAKTLGEAKAAADAASVAYAAARAADAARAAAGVASVAAWAARIDKHVWAVAAEGFRSAIELGRDEALISNIDWEGRHAEMRELVA